MTHGLSWPLGVLGRWECIGNSETCRLISGVHWTCGTNNPTFFAGDVNFILEFIDDKFIECDRLHMEDSRGLMCNVQYDPEDSFGIIIKHKGNEPMLQFTFNFMAVNNMICPSYKIMVPAMNNFANFRTGIVLPISSPDGTFAHFQAALSLVELRWYFDLLRERLKPKPRLALDSSLDVEIDSTTRPDIICKICRSFVSKYVALPCGHPCCCGSCYRDIVEKFPAHLTKCVLCKDACTLHRIYL